MIRVRFTLKEIDDVVKEEKKLKDLVTDRVKSVLPSADETLCADTHRLVRNHLFVGGFPKERPSWAQLLTVHIIPPTPGKVSSCAWEQDVKV